MKIWMIRVAASLPGVLLLINAVGLIIAPEGVVTSLGMTYLDGLGRSSQLGDTGGFFACGGLFILFGALRARTHWIMAGAYLFLAAAIYRILATVMHGAEFATTFITVERVSFVWLVIASKLVTETETETETETGAR